MGFATTYRKHFYRIPPVACFWFIKMAGVLRDSDLCHHKSYPRKVISAMTHSRFSRQAILPCNKIGSDNMHLAAICLIMSS